MLMPLLQLVLPPGAVGDVEAKDTLPDAGSSGHEGPVVRLEVLVAVAQFVMVIVHIVAGCCCLVALCCCVVPLVSLQMEKVLGE